MPNKALITELVGFYWRLVDDLEVMNDIGRVGSDEEDIIEQQIADLDKILTNVSKRWAENKKLNGCPVRE